MRVRIAWRSTLACCFVIAGAAALLGIRANLYRFDFEFEPEPDAWQLARAAWRPAQFEDFR